MMRTDMPMKNTWFVSLLLYPNITIDYEEKHSPKEYIPFDSSYYLGSL
jgi:hypothetical protein